MGANQSRQWQSLNEEHEPKDAGCQRNPQQQGPLSVHDLHFEKISGFCFRAEWRSSRHENLLFNVIVYRNGEREMSKDRLRNKFFTVTGCRPSSEYKVVVYPSNNQGIEGPAKSRIFWADPTPIHGLRINEDQGKVHLSWEEPQEDNILYKIKSYEGRWWGWKKLGREWTDQSHFWLRSPTPKTQYYFSIRPQNSHKLIGEKKEVYWTSTGKYTVTVYLLKKEPNHIIVLYDTDEERLHEKLQRWLDDGYVSVRATSFPVILYRFRKYKSKIKCETRAIPITPDAGQELEDQLLLDDHTVSYTFIAEATKRGQYVLEFNLEEDGTLIRTEPFIINTPGSQPAPQINVNAVSANFGENGGVANLHGADVNIGGEQINEEPNNNSSGNVPAHPVPENANAGTRQQQSGTWINRARNNLRHRGARYQQL